MALRNEKKKRIFALLLFCAVTGLAVTACKKEEEREDKGRLEAVATPSAEAGINAESGKDGEIDFVSLKEENPDIFGWLYIPGTDIDYPVLQSSEADDFYETHDAYGRENKSGALYTELANLTNMCDFNTVIHGKDADVKGPFSELYRYTDETFMEEHGEAYFYMEGNVLTYEIFASYERENTSLIRTYDFTYASGCQAFLDDLYENRVMGKVIRKEWEGVTPYHFLITLTTQREDNPDKQFVVVAALVGDAAGVIDRVVE